MKGYGIPMFKKVTGYIYFIQMDRIGPVKIGFTKNIEKRLVSLQTACPYPLNLLCIFPGNEDMETDIHSCFKEMRMEGEWFLPHPFILGEIENFKKINKKNNFILPDSNKDLGDWSLINEATH